MDEVKKLKKLAAARGLSIEDCGNGHYQITGGALLVNYYPNSSRRTAYVAGTVKAVTHCSPEKAIELSGIAPSLAATRDYRRGQGTKRRRKRRLWKKESNRVCYVCQKPMTFDDATIEHRIPLARGGLDNDNNCALSHAKCNHARGHDMPELSNANTAPAR